MASLNKYVQLFIKTSNNLQTFKMLLWRGEGPIARPLNIQEENLMQIEVKYLIALLGI